MKKGAIVFDFDGVLADSFKPLYALNRDAMRAAGRTLTPQGYRDLFGDNIHKALEKKMGGPGELKRLKAFKAKRFSRYYKRARLFGFTKGLVQELGARYKMGIVSSTAAALIRGLLKTQRLENRFAVILGALGTSKETEVRKAVRRIGKGAYAKTFFVSDTTGDLKLGKRLGMPALGVAWGFHSEGALRKTRPQKLFRKPGDLRDYLLSAGEDKK